MEVPGFSKSQRQWVLARDKNRCQFFYRKLGIWRQCPNPAEHVH